MGVAETLLIGWLVGWKSQQIMIVGNALITSGPGRRKKVAGDSTNQIANQISGLRMEKGTR